MKVFISFFFLLACGSTPGQQLKKLDGKMMAASAIEAAVGKLMDCAKVQGLNLAILNDDKVAYVQSFGFGNKPKGAKMDNSTIVYAASFSKAVFAYLVMELVEDGLLDLNKPLYQYLKKPIPAYEYFGDLEKDERWKLITARMCLSHTTGLPNVRWFHPITEETDTLGVMRIYFDPGSKYAYSGEGFKLLQLVIEEVTGKTTDELAIANIFKPVGMSRTGFIWHDSFGDENVAVGHLNDGSIDQKRKRTEAVAGGSLVTTIDDYAKFVAHVMQRKGLAGKYYDEMLSPQIRIRSKTQFPPITTETTTDYDGINLSYGLGWGVFRCNDVPAFFKEGNGGSWRNYNINYPSKGISVIIMTNSENGEQLFQELLETILGETCIPWKWNGYVPYQSAK